MMRLEIGKEKEEKTMRKNDDGGSERATGEVTCRRLVSFDRTRKGLVFQD